MHDSNKGFLPFRHGITLSNDECNKTPEEIEKMKAISYALALGCLMYAMLCYALEQISIFSLAWFTDMSLTQGRIIGMW